MPNTARQTRENRTITVDFHNEATYLQILGDSKAFVECVLAFLLAPVCQLAHKATCRGGGCLTRHSHYARVRLGRPTIWRVQCTTLDQAHNAIERKLSAMKGFHHPEGSQQAFLTGLAHLYNLIPYQRRALHAGKCRVEAEGGHLPTSDWMLNLQILTSGGYQCAPAPPNH